MIQIVVVIVLVVLAGAYLLWRYMPQKWRQPLGKINPRLAQVAGCSGCSHCDGTKTGVEESTSRCGAGGEAAGIKPVVLHEPARRPR